MTTVAGVSRARTEKAVRARNVVFAAPRDDPRARRPADAAVLVFTALVVAAAGAIHRAGNDLDARVLRLFDGGLPGWISGTLTIGFLVGGLFALALLAGVAVLGHGRGAVARDMLAAAALVALVASVLSGITGPEWPDVLPVWLERDGFPSYPVLDLSIAVAIVGVANPYLSLSMRRLGGRLLGLMAVAAIVMRYGTLSGVVGGYAVGTAAAAAIHLIFGSGAGIPSKARIRAALAACGVDTTNVEYLDRQPVGATLVKAELADGSHALVKIYGRDAAEAAFASRLWRALWYRGNTPALTSGLQLVEHESLMLLASARGHAPVPALVGWGSGEAGDAVVATEWLDAPRLIDLAPEQIDDSRLDAIWKALAQLHRARIAHGALDGRRITLRGGEVILDDLEAARISSDDATRAADRAQLLAATAVIVGRERAVAAAHRNVDHDDLIATLPVLQRATMSRALERDIHSARLKLGDLRDDVATALGTKAPQLAQLKRVSWAHVGLVALSAFAAYTLITQLAEIGFDTLAQQMGSADWSWIVIAFVLAQMTNVGEYVSLTGMVARPVPFAPTIMFRYAIAFIDLAVPGDAGAIAMNVRYMQRLGVSAAGSRARTTPRHRLQSHRRRAARTLRALRGRSRRSRRSHVRAHLPASRVGSRCGRDRHHRDVHSAEAAQSRGAAGQGGAVGDQSLAYRSTATDAHRRRHAHAKDPLCRGAQRVGNGIRRRAQLWTSRLGERDRVVARRADTRTRWRRRRRSGTHRRPDHRRSPGRNCCRCRDNPPNGHLVHSADLRLLRITLAHRARISLMRGNRRR